MLMPSHAAEKLSCFSLYGQTPHGTNWANTTGEFFFFSKRESVTQWVSCMQNEFARSPFGARHSLSGSRSPCYGKTTAYKLGMWCTHRPSTGNDVTATHQEEVATAALRLGKDAPREAAQLPQPPRPG